MDLQFNKSEMIFEEDDASEKGHHGLNDSFELRDTLSNLKALKEGLRGREGKEGFSLRVADKESDTESIVDIDKIDEELLSRDFSAQAAALKQLSVVRAADPAFGGHYQSSEATFDPRFRSQYYETFQDWQEAGTSKDANAFNARIFREEGFDSSEAAF